MILHFKGLKILKESFHLDCYINQIKVIDTNKFNILNEYSIIEDNDGSATMIIDLTKEELKLIFLINSSS